MYSAARVPTDVSELAAMIRGLQLDGCLPFFLRLPVNMARIVSGPYAAEHD
jgi:hypothetical protein